MTGIAHVPYLEHRKPGFLYRRRIPARLLRLRGPPAVVTATGLEIRRQSGQAPRGVVRALSRRSARGPYPVAAGFMDRLSPLISSTPRNCANADLDVPTAWSRIVIPLAISQREKDHRPELQARVFQKKGGKRSFAASANGKELATITDLHPPSDTQLFAKLHAETSLRRARGRHAGLSHRGSLTRSRRHTGERS